jgi:uncharacterized membrane protein
MIAFLMIVVLLLVIWLARSSSKASETESRLAELTSRVFHLEQDLEKLRTLTPEERLDARHAPTLREALAKKNVMAPEIERVAKPPAAPVAPTVVSASQPAPPQAPVSSTLPHFAMAEPRGFSPRSLLNLEETLGTNWLNKLGITILVIGVALFLAYQLRELGPQGKITVGYVVSFVMLAAGVVFERREMWRLLARAGIAGGWSLVYFTTYAMYHVPAARVLSSESVDLILLLAAAAAMVAHTLRYQSQVVTGLTFLLAFTTINISRGNANSLIASAILAAVLAVIAVRRQWFEMELVGMAAAFVNHYLWLRPIIEPMHGHIHAFAGYVASSALLVGYWLIFRASYMVRRIDNPRQEQASTIAALLNPALLLAVMGYQSVHPELSFQFLLALGGVELVLGQLPVTRKRRAAFVVLTTLGSCLLVAAFPRRYANTTLSISWLAEAETLLLVGVFLREILFRRLGLVTALLVWIQMVGADAGQVYFERMYGIDLGGRPGLGLFFGIAAAVLYANAHWIPRHWPRLIETDLEQLCFRRMSHLAGVLAFVGAWIAWPEAWTALAWAALALTLSYVGQRWQVREVSLDGMVCAAATVLRVLIVNLGAKQTLPDVPWMTERLLTISLVAALIYLASRMAGVREIVTAEQAAPVYTWAASGLIALLAWYELRPVGVALGWTLLGLVLLEVGVTRRSAPLRLQAYVAFAASFLRLFFVNLNAAGNEGAISPRLYTTVPLAGAFYYVYLRLKDQTADHFALERRIHSAAWHSLLGILTLSVLVRFEFDADLVAVGWAALALIWVALAWKSGTRLFLHQGLLLAFGVLFRATLHNLYERSYFPAPFGHGRVVTVGATVALLGLALPFALSLRRLNANRTASGKWYRRFLEALDERPEQVFFFIPFALLTAMLAVEVRIGMVTLAWGLEAVAVFLLALAVKERSFRLSGLGLLLVCVGKIILRDVWGLPPRDRYLTFIVLGTALLLVSYLYTRYRDILRQYL